MDGLGRSNTMCGLTITNNIANSEGGGFFRVSYTGVEPNVMSQTVWAHNTVNTGLGGAAYVQGGRANIQNSVFYANQAPKSNAGAVYIGPMSWNTLFNNLLFVNNTCMGLGSSLAIDVNTSGTIQSSTFAYGYATAFATISGGSGLRMANTIVADNTIGNIYVNYGCHDTFIDGGGNFQYPKDIANAVSCTNSVSFVNPMLRFNLTRYCMSTASGSPAAGKGFSCIPYATGKTASNVLPGGLVTYVADGTPVPRGFYTSTCTASGCSPLDVNANSISAASRSFASVVSLLALTMCTWLVFFELLC